MPLLGTSQLFQKEKFLINVLVDGIILLCTVRINSSLLFLFPPAIEMVLKEEKQKEPKIERTLPVFPRILSCDFAELNDNYQLPSFLRAHSILCITLLAHLFIHCFVITYSHAGLHCWPISALRARSMPYLQFMLVPSMMASLGWALNNCPQKTQKLSIPFCFSSSSAFPFSLPQIYLCLHCPVRPLLLKVGLSFT